MPIIKICPFLDLEKEGLSCDVFHTDCDRIGTIVRERAHYNYWIIELVLDCNFIPKRGIRLTNW